MERSPDAIAQAVNNVLRFGRALQKSWGRHADVLARCAGVYVGSLGVDSGCEFGGRLPRQGVAGSGHADRREEGSPKAIVGRNHDRPHHRQLLHRGHGGTSPKPAPASRTQRLQPAALDPSSSSSHRHRTTILPWSSMRKYSRRPLIAGREIIPCSKMLEQRRVKLAGHVLRSSSTDPMRQISYQPDSASPCIIGRRVGRPRQQWLHNTNAVIYGVNR